MALLKTLITKKNLFRISCLLNVGQNLCIAQKQANASLLITAAQRFRANRCAYSLQKDLTAFILDVYTNISLFFCFAFVPKGAVLCKRKFVIIDVSQRIGISCYTDVFINQM